MKLDIQEILERFALIASLPMEEAVGYTALCSDAAGELTRRLRGTVSENNASRLEPAAASLAYYRYAMYQAANAEDFTVGDITVASGRDDKIRLAREVWMEAEREIADLLSDDGFVFRGVSEKYAAVRRLIRLCGRNVKLVMEATGEIKNVRAVIQPLRYRNNANAGGIYLPPGFSDLRITFIWGLPTNR